MSLTPDQSFQPKNPNILDSIKRVVGLAILKPQQEQRKNPATLNQVIPLAKTSKDLMEPDYTDESKHP